MDFKRIRNNYYCFGIVAVLELWGIKVGPVIAGLGLFGVAVALGAQDLFKNLIKWNNDFNGKKIYNWRCNFSI